MIPGAEKIAAGAFVLERSMSAITVWQPWATLIAEGLKQFEFRRWPTPDGIRGRRIAIHAGARPVKKVEIAELIVKLGGKGWRRTGLTDRDRCVDLLGRWHTSPGMLPLSSVLCTAIIGVPIRNVELAERLGIDLINDSDRHEHSNWGWPLTEVRRLEPPVPARGAQNFWRWAPPRDPRHALA